MSFYEFRSLISGVLSWFLNSKCFIPVIVICLLITGIIFYVNRRKTKYVFISDINAFNITIKLDMKNIDIAYMMYVELSTRKIGIEFEEDDVIIEVYNSWYSAFKTIRELLLSIRPIPKNKELIEVGTSILNIGLRPHLTRWQAKYRKWYDNEIKKEENKNLSPQEIQRKYPSYDELVLDMKNSQSEVLKFLKSLKDIFE